MNKVKVIAFYLPQFHPIKENNEWYGKGFTEWTNVAKAKPLFKGHYQPRIPADLGFYDLRLPQVREEQVALAKQAGISAFCYYHYWFAGKQIMEGPLNAIIETKKPDFPFCICWANASWYKKEWNPNTKILENEMTMEQTYPGDKDIEDHFYALLPAFKDKRYYRIDNKPVFFIYQVQLLPDFSHFKRKWEHLAKQNGIEGFFYVTYTTEIGQIQSPVLSQCDAIVLSLINHAANKGKHSLLFSLKNKIMGPIKNMLHIPKGVIDYSEAIQFLTDEVERQENVFPVIVPNWDHTARRGYAALIFHNSTPALFKKHVKNALKLIARKSDERKVLFLKSWNEWAEGNYMEPDLVFKDGYIRALREALDEFEK